jgi:hypothetical protein
MHSKSTAVEQPRARGNPGREEMRPPGAQPAPVLRKAKRFIAKSDTAAYEIHLLQRDDVPGYVVEFQNLRTNKRSRLGSADHLLPSMEDVLKECFAALRAEDPSVFGLLPFPDDDD